MSTRKMNGDTLEIIIDNVVIVSLTEKLVNDQMIMTVTGEIKNEVAHEFEDELMAAFSVCKTVKVDMSGVTYIASIAMRALLSVQQIIDENDGSSLVIMNISPEVKKEFESSGFLDILNIEE